MIYFFFFLIRFFLENPEVEKIVGLKAYPRLGIPGSHGIQTWEGLEDLALDQLVQVSQSADFQLYFEYALIKYCWNFLSLY